MRRRAETVGGLRDDLAANWRAFALGYAERLDVPPESAERSPYWERADALDRGEAVRVASWEVASFLPAPHERGRLTRLPYWWVLEPDGTLRPDRLTNTPERRAPNE